MPVPSPSPLARAGDTRRLRDLLRIAVAGRTRPGGLLPGEDALMLGFAASRSAVRAALTLLSDEGLLRPGPAAYRVVARPEYTGTADAVADPQRPARWLDRAGVAAPEVLADWLQVPLGSPCLRLECVTATADGGAVLETHYLAGSGAAELLAVPGTGSFDGLLAAGGLRAGDVRSRSGPVPADPDAALLLGVRPGTPLLGAERTLSGADGRVLAAGVVRAHAAAAVPAARSGGGAPAQAGSNARTASSESASAGVLSGR